MDTSRKRLTVCTRLQAFDWITLTTWIFAMVGGCQLIAPAFLFFEPAWKCGPDDAFSRLCDVKTNCPNGSLIVEQSVFYSASQEWNLSCTDNGPYIVNILSTLTFFGILIGTVTLGRLSDRVGRRPVAICNVIVFIVNGVVESLVPHWRWMMATRFIFGLNSAGYMVVTYALVLEQLLTDARIFQRSFYNWGISKSIFTFCCFLFPKWRQSTLATVLVAGLPFLLSIIFIVPESCLWLKDTGRRQQHRAARRRINNINKSMSCKTIESTPFKHKNEQTMKFIDDDAEVTQDRQSQCDAFNAKNAKSSLSIKRLFIPMTQAKHTLVLCCMWITCSFSTYVVDLNSRNLSGQFFANQFIFCLTLIISKMLLFVVYGAFPQFKRRPLHQLSQLLAIFTIATVIVLSIIDASTHGAAITYLNFTASVLLEYTWDAAYLCAIEGFDTRLRTTGLGVCSMSARIGAILAPQAIYLSSYWQPAVYVFVASINSVCLVLSFLFLPETDGIDLSSIHANEE